jgi:hypothetical protein
MIELHSKELGYSGKWLKAAENSVADEMVLADPFFTPDAYINPKSYPTKIMFSAISLEALSVGAVGGSKL